MRARVEASRLLRAPGPRRRAQRPGGELGGARHLERGPQPIPRGGRLRAAPPRPPRASPRATSTRPRVALATRPGRVRRAAPPAHRARRRARPPPPPDRAASSTFTSSGRKSAWQTAHSPWRAEDLARLPQRVLGRVHRAGREPVPGHRGVEPGERVAAERGALGEHHPLAEELHALVDAPAGGEERAQPIERERLPERGARRDGSERAPRAGRSRRRRAGRRESASAPSMAPAMAGRDRRPPSRRPGAQRAGIRGELAEGPVAEEVVLPQHEVHLERLLEPGLGAARPLRLSPAPAGEHGQVPTAVRQLAIAHLERRFRAAPRQLQRLLARARVPGELGEEVEHLGALVSGAEHRVGEPGVELGARLGQAPADEERQRGAAPRARPLLRPGPPAGASPSPAARSKVRAAPGSSASASWTCPSASNSSRRRGPPAPAASAAASARS